MAESTADKARRARNHATEGFGGVSYGKTKRIVQANSKTATGQNLTYGEERAAGKIVQARRQNDANRTASRATFIEKREKKQASTARVTAAVGGTTKKKKKKMGKTK